MLTDDGCLSNVSIVVTSITFHKLLDMLECQRVTINAELAAPALAQLP